MSLVTDKIRKAVSQRRNLRLRVNQTPFALYSQEREGLPYFTLAWYEGSRRQRKSSSSEHETVETAEEIISRLCAPTPTPAHVLSSQTEFINGIPLADLLKVYHQHRPQQPGTGAPPIAPPTVPEIVKECEQAAESSGRSPRHIQTLRHHFTKLAAQLPVAINAVSTRDLDLFLGQFQNLKTRSNVRISVIALFNFAKRKGYLPEGTTNADRTERPKVVQKDPGIFTPADLEKLLRACSNPKLLSFLVIGAFCGCRTAEILRLNWPHVAEDHVTLPTAVTKNARRRVAELPENARQWLAPIRRDSGPVSYRSPAALYAALKDLCNVCSIEWDNNALRHSFASYHLELHRDPPRTSKTAGHSLRVLETSYTKLVSQTDANLWFSIRPQSPKT